MAFLGPGPTRGQSLASSPPKKSISPAVTSEHEGWSRAFNVHHEVSKGRGRTQWLAGSRDWPGSQKSSQKLSGLESHLCPLMGLMVISINCLVKGNHPAWGRGNQLPPLELATFMTTNDAHDLSVLQVRFPPHNYLLIKVAHFTHILVLHVHLGVHGNTKRLITSNKGGRSFQHVVRLSMDFTPFIPSV